MTAIAVRRDERRWSRAVETVVRFRRLGDREIDAYLASGEWKGKAGGYAIQGRAGGLRALDRRLLLQRCGPPRAETLGLLEAAGVLPA